MANLTVVIDDELLKRARIRALEQGSSVNALLREYLEHYAGGDTQSRAMREFCVIAERAGGHSGGRTWTRDEIHER